MPTNQERLDPNSPHYDAAFAELRRKAFGAWDDHQRDLRDKPEYRREVHRQEGLSRSAQKRLDR